MKMETNGKMRCAGKVAVVTGTSSGIGLATAKMMVEEGADLYALDFEVDVAERNAVEINAKGPGKIRDIIYFDASDTSCIENAINEVYKKAGRIDIFVNNAIWVKPVNAADNLTITDTSHKTMMDQMQGIVGVTADCMRAAIPIMVKSGGGNIVNISSIASHYADMDRTYYNVGKSAVNAITQHVALQYGRQGIRCNAVLPGITVAGNTLGLLPKDFAETWLKHAPIRRLGKPEDHAKAVMFFATDDSEWVTGQFMEVAGGFGLGSPNLELD